MNKFLIDWKTTRVRKYVINNSFSTSCLFDRYLTGTITYPHFGHMAYLTERIIAVSKTYLNPLFSSISLFDGYLTEH